VVPDSGNEIVSGIAKTPEELNRTIGQWLWGASEHKDAVRIVGHNIAYDMAVLAAHHPAWLPTIFRAYEQGSIDDTKIRQQLLDIADGSFWTKRKTGGYTLQSLASRHLGMSMPKGEDTWRLRYGELLNVDLKDWPSDAKEYAIKDAEATYQVFAAQGPVTDSKPQTSYAWALHLASCWGVVTDKEKVDHFTREAKDSMAVLREKLSRSGLMRVDGTKNLKAVRERVSKFSGEKNVKLTDKGNVATDEATLRETLDPELGLLVDFSKAQKLDSVWSRYLLQGTDIKTPIQASFHCLVESGRTSCSKPNLQNPHRATGLRECFVPRPGHLFAACDYSTLELCTLAQINSWLFKDCNMARKLREGADLHLHFASVLLNIPYEEAVARTKSPDPAIAKEIKKTRQMAKVANFGYPGGMGSESFRSYAKGYGLEIGETAAKTLKNNWFKAWPEMEKYFNFVGNQIQGSGYTGKIKQFISNRVRGNVSFTQACNSYFQGLAADGAKYALFNVSRLCYSDPKSVLYGSRPVMFIHDEIIIESPEDRAPEAAEELAQVMRKSMQAYTPDIPIKTDVALMNRWYKDAEETRTPRGELKLWQPAA
tara:strand:- start:8561 stop:10348 length:1788 start_codon:yes stop_codon:yes gene_type:complete